MFVQLLHRGNVTLEAVLLCRISARCDTSGPQHGASGRRPHESRACIQYKSALPSPPHPALVRYYLIN